jgi:hypothetical protein
MTGQEEGRLLHRRDHGWDECGQRAAGPLLGLAYNVSRRRLEMGHLAWGCCRRPLLRHADAACNWARPHRTIRRDAAGCLLWQRRDTTQKLSSGAARPQLWQRQAHANASRDAP